MMKVKIIIIILKILFWIPIEEVDHKVYHFYSYFLDVGASSKAKSENNNGRMLMMKNRLKTNYNQIHNDIIR